MNTEASLGGTLAEERIVLLQHWGPASRIAIVQVGSAGSGNDQTHLSRPFGHSQAPTTSCGCSATRRSGGCRCFETTTWLAEVETPEMVVHTHPPVVICRC